jgi:hypothetical protein
LLVEDPGLAQRGSGAVSAGVLLLYILCRSLTE